MEKTAKRLFGMKIRGEGSGPFLATNKTSRWKISRGSTTRVVSGVGIIDEVPVSKDIVLQREVIVRLEPSLCDRHHIPPIVCKIA